MTILAHAKENHVKYRQIIGNFCRFQKIVRSFLKRERFRAFTAQPMYLRRRYFQRVKQKLFCQGKIAFRIAWRHAALIGPEEMDIRKNRGACLGGEGVGLALAGEFLEERFHDSAAGERDGVVGSGIFSRAQLGQPVCGGIFCEFGVGGKRKELVGHVLR